MSQRLLCTKCKTRAAVTIRRPHYCLKCLRFKIDKDTPLPLPVINEQKDRTILGANRLSGAEMLDDGDDE